MFGKSDLAREIESHLALLQERRGLPPEADATSQPRFEMLLFGLFAAVALLLAAVGIYGVMNHSVSRRTREIRIRISFGASRAAVLAGTAVGFSGSPLSPISVTPGFQVFLLTTNRCARGAGNHRCIL